MQRIARLHHIGFPEFSGFVFVEVEHDAFLWPVDLFPALLTALHLFVPLSFTHVVDVLVLHSVFQSVHLVDRASLGLEHYKNLFCAGEWLFTLDSLC